MSGLSFGRARTCRFNVLLYNTLYGRPSDFCNGLIKLSCSIVIMLTNTSRSSNISHPFLRHDCNLDVFILLVISFRFWFPLLVFLFCFFFLSVLFVEVLWMGGCFFSGLFVAVVFGCCFWRMGTFF